MAELNQIKYPDITNGLAAYAKFYDVGQKMQERNALSEAGGLYAQGDKQGAVNSLAQAGQLGEATALEKSFRDAARQADADKLAKAQRFNEVLGNLVMTVKGLPPEKQPAAWNTAIDSAKGAGLDVEKYRDPGTMDFILAQANKTGELLKLELDRRKAEASAAAKAPSGYRQTADGNLTFIPGGPADPNVKPKGRDKYTEGQTKAANFGNMMMAAEADLEKMSGGQPLQNPKNFLGATRDALVPFDGIANLMTPDATQNYNQLAAQWIRAKLRKESGAAIGTDEMEKEFRTYFPQYGDGPETRASKARARAEAIKGMIAESGGAYDQLFPSKKAEDERLPEDPNQPSSRATTTATPAPVQVRGIEEATQLPSGTVFVTPDGRMKVRP